MERQKQVALIYEKNTGKKSPATLPFGYFLYFNPHKSMSYIFFNNKIKDP